jgi:hypothetical protein
MRNSEFCNAHAGSICKRSRRRCGSCATMIRSKTSGRVFKTGLAANTVAGGFDFFPSATSIFLAAVSRRLRSLERHPRVNQD